MAKGEINLRDELRAYKFEFDLLEKIPCSKSENKEYEELIKNGGSLPEGVYAYVDVNGTPMNEFYAVYEADLTESERNEYLKYKQLSSIQTIKKCVLFFTVLTVLNLIGTVLMLLVYYSG